MAQLPPQPLFALPFRIGNAKKTEWAALTKYIRTNHGTKFNVGPTIDKMAELRKMIISTCARGSAGVNEAFIDSTLKKYIQLLVMAQGHLPLHGGKVEKLVFSWKNAWSEEEATPSANANLEAVSLVYNLGVAYATIGASEALTGTVESVKLAFQAYQQAAGVFDYLTTLVQRLPGEDVTFDLSDESIKLCKTVTLAQAHHCSLIKAMLEGKVKTDLVCKIAVQGATMYTDAALAGRADIQVFKTPLGQQLVGSCEAWAQLLTARAHLLLGQAALQAESIGDAMGRCKYSLDGIAKAEAITSKDKSLTNWVQHLKYHADEIYGKAVKENETVHFERATKEFPPLDSLGKPLGKPTPCPSLTTFKARKDEDPFFGIIPAHVQSTVAEIQQRMRGEIRTCIESVGSHRKRTRELLSALGVHSVIESQSEEAKTRGRVPESLRNKILFMQQNNKGESLVASVLGVLGHVTQVSASVSENIETIEGLLKQERDEDLQYRTTYGDKLWGELRKPSNQLPDVLTLKKLMLDLQEAIGREVTVPVNEVKSEMEANLRELSRLDWPIEDLDALMPYTKTKQAQQTDSVVVAALDRLQKNLTRIDQSDKLQDEKFIELRGLQESEELMHQLSAVSEDQQDMIKESIESEFTDRLSVIASAVSTIDTVMGEMEALMLKVAEIKSSDPLALEIQQVCNSISGAINLYESLHQRVSSLATSATQLNEQASNAIGIAQSLVEGRHLEAEDFKETLESQVAMKVRQMSETNTVDESRQRQVELQRQIDMLEEQRRQHATGQPVANVAQPVAAPQQPPPPQGYAAPPAQPYQQPFAPPVPQPQHPYQQQPPAPAPQQPDYMSQYTQQSQQTQLDAIFGQSRAPQAAPAGGQPSAPASYQYNAPDIPPPPSYSP